MGVDAKKLPALWIGETEDENRQSMQDLHRKAGCVASEFMG